MNYKLLKAKVSQQILRRLDKNFKSFFQANKDFNKNPTKYKGNPKPPRYKSNYHDNLIYNYQAFQVKGIVSVIENPIIKTRNLLYPIVSLIEYKQVAILEKGLEIKIPNQLWGKHIKQIEIIPKHHSFNIVFAYQENTEDYKKVKPFIIDGKRLKYINALYNKRKAKIQSKLQERNKKWSCRLENITNKRNRAVKDYLHKATAIVVKNCIEHDISKVVIGNLAKSLYKINLGKQTNQNFVNLALGQFIC